MKNKYRYFSVGIIFISLISLNACKNQSSKNNLEGPPDIIGLDSVKNSEYLQREKAVSNFLDSNGLGFLNDTAKWHLYTIYCDYLLPKSVEKTSKNIYLSFLPIKPLYYSKSNDTLEIYYSFIYKNLRIENFPPDSTNYRIVDGIRFNLKTNKIIDFISGPGSFSILGSKSRFVNLLQPEVVTFVKNNLKNIHPWYKNELMKHGVIEK
jgi:hypothetical protein